MRTPKVNEHSSKQLNCFKSCFHPYASPSIVVNIMSQTAVVSSVAPPRVVHSTTQRASRPATKLPQFLVDEAQIADKQSFDPKMHVNFEPPSKIYTMKEIGLEGQGISPNAVTAPFQLFTTEAIRQMRAEIFSEPVLADCRYTSPFVKNTIRGMGSA